MRLDADLPLPFPPDPQQVAMIETIAVERCVIASQGTDRFDALSILVEGGYLAAAYCPKAQGVYQFTLTAQGLEVLQ